MSMAVSTALRQYGKPLQPATLAFGLALLSTAGPRALSVLIALVRKRRLRELSSSLIRVLGAALQLNRFPAFCAVLIGGSTLLETPIYRLLSSARLRNDRLRILSKFLAALLSAGYSFHLLNQPDKYQKDTPRPSRERSFTNHHHPLIPPSIPALPAGIETPVPVTTPQAGKTTDLTLFTFVRAVDALLTLSPPPRSPKLKKVYDKAATWSAPLLFVASCAAIMHAFFYAPLRLPGTYVRWISRIAGVDPRLLHALRQARLGSWEYGKDTGMAPLLKGMCEDLNVPKEWADPAKTIPVPCELVHHGMAKSCETHAIQRWARSWLIALGVYAPLAVVILVRRLQGVKTKRIQVVLATATAAGRSAAFLATFVALFYYGVCLARTRVGPRVFPAVTAQEWDKGLCIETGCALCGWSILVETSKRQVELMLFVLPRALATITGRRYGKRKRWMEHIVFTISAAVVLTAAREKKGGVRGVLGGVLGVVYGK